MKNLHLEDAFINTPESEKIFPTTAIIIMY